MADEKRFHRCMPGLFFCFPVAANSQPPLWKRGGWGWVGLFSLFPLFHPSEAIWTSLVHSTLGFVSILILWAFPRQIVPRWSLASCFFFLSPTSSQCSGGSSILCANVGRRQLGVTSLSPFHPHFPPASVSSFQTNACMKWVWDCREVCYCSCLELVFSSPFQFEPEVPSKMQLWATFENLDVESKLPRA